MIRVENLVKLYKDKSGIVVGLDSINFSLPSKGMIFVVGKSGCGKTTLLNILGGLDGFDSGEIFVGDKQLSKFSNVELDNYRNSSIGFVFQDFCLIDKMSVEDNIKLSVEFQNNKDYENIDDILKEVDLEGLKNRKPTQLSAGQKQRVAIARAIIKNPDIILADEPTGNVDEKTSHQILKLLKKISLNKLVIIISHNKEEAELYADRILTMSDGKIISDKALTNNYLEIIKFENNFATIPYNGKINEEHLDKLNYLINNSDGNFQIYQSDEKFVDANYEKANEKLNIKKAKMSVKTKFKYTSFFFKKKFIFNLFIIILITFVTSIFTVVEQIGYCDLNTEFSRMLNESQYIDMTLFEASDTTKAFVKIDESNTKEMASKYNVDVDFTHLINIPFTNKQESLILQKSDLNSSVIFDGKVLESNSVRTTSIKNLTDLFGDLSIIKGHIKNDGTGVIITDYLADCIISFSNIYNSYDQIVDGGRIANSLDVDAIIKTNVYEKFDLQFNDFEAYKEDSAFINSLLTTYSYCYSLNENFINDYIDESYNLKTATSTSLISTVSSLKGDSITIPYAQTIYDTTLLENEINLSFEKYNLLFNTSINHFNYASSFTPYQNAINISLFDGNGNMYFSKVLFISSLFESNVNSNECFKLSFDNYYNIVTNEIFTYGIVFQTNNNENALFYDFLTSRSWTIKISMLNFIYSTVEMYSVFKDVFKYVGYLLTIAIFLIIILNANTLIRHNSYEIGLMKAFGAKTKEIVFIFATLMAITSLSVCVVLFFMSQGVVSFSNNLILKGILAYLNSSTITKLSFNALIFNKNYFILNVLIISISTIISVIVPILSIRNIKPLKIIKTRN